MERLIAKNRLSGKSFSEMDEKGIRYAIDQIMLRGAAISGAALPQTEFFATFIASELTFFINEMGYNDLTLDEIMLSLRLNAKGDIRYPSGDYVDRIEFSGQSFNVTYIAKILSVYMALRNSFDRKLQNQIDGY